MEKKLIQFMMAIIAIPLGSKEGWTELQFKKLKPNEVTVVKEGLKLNVDESASPLIYKLPVTQSVKSFEAQVIVHGLVRAKTKWDEDSVFRLGLVVEGDKRLTGVRKYLAANWVLKLFSLAPEDTGLDKIYFFNVGANEKNFGSIRIHPKSELMSEEIITLQKEGELTIKKTFETPLKVLALWISSDGDDTKSKFTTTIKMINLETVK